MNRETFTALRISGLILALTLSVVVPAEGQFQQIPGALQQVSVGADGAVWGINDADQIFRYDQQSQGWDRIPGSLSQIAVGSSKSIWGINAGGSIFRFDAGTQNWDRIPGLLAEIAVGADGDTWGINRARQIFHYIPAVQNWQYVAGSLSQISVGFDGAVWGLNPGGDVYRYNIGKQVFEQLPGTLSQIEVGADGDVWGVDPDHGIWHFNSLLQSWDPIAGRLWQISVGSATNVWGLDASGNIYNFNIQAQSWTQVPGSLEQISAGADGSFWGINSVESIYQFTRPPQSAQTWRPIPGVLAQVSVGPDGNLWGINAAQQIYHFNLLRQNWDFIPGSLSQIAVGFGGEVWGINSAQFIYRYDTSIGSWQYIPGQLAQIAVGANGDVWGINSGEYIYRFDRNAQAWQWIPGFLKQLSVGADGAVWGINDADQIFRYDQQSQGWDWIPGSLSQIAVGSSNCIWGINAGGSIFHFDAGTQNWDWVPGSLSQIAVGFDCSVWGINSASQVFRFDPTAGVWYPTGGLLSQIAVGSDETVVGLNSSGAIFVDAGTITSVVAMCSPTSILTTQTSQCTASVTGTGTYSSSVSWSATGGTITSSGFFTPSSTGTASITATSVEDPTKSGSATVTVAVTGWKSLYPISGGIVPTVIVDSEHTAYAAASANRVGKPGGTPGYVQGILKTVDYGVTWLGANGDLPAPVSGPVVADPVTPGVLYAWTTLGLFKTVNGGTHWSQLPLTLPAGVAAEQIAIAPTNTNRIYVSTMGASVQCSTDGGNTWTECSTGLYALNWPSSGPDYVTAMAVSPTNELVAYTATWRGLLFKTIDGGNHWVTIGDTSNIWAVSQIYIAPSNPNVLYLQNDEYYFGRGTVLTSTDAGNTWTDAGRPDGQESDAAQLQILPTDPNTVYAATSAGLYETTTGGGVWKQVFDGSYLLSVALDPAKSTLYVGSLYNGVYESTDGGKTWGQDNLRVFNVQVAGLDVCSSAPNTIYAAAQGGVPIATADSGATWSQIGAVGTNGQVVIALACSPASPSHLLVGTENYEGALHNQGVGILWVTDDGGLTFYEASVSVQNPGYSFFPGSFGFNPQDPSLVNSSLQDYQGGFLYSVDGGSSWTQPNPIYIYPGDYAYHPNLANIVFTNTNEYHYNMPFDTLYIAYSTDSGETWQTSPVGGQGHFASTVALDQADPTVLYTAGYIQTEGTSGVYKFKVAYTGDQVSSVTRIPGTFNTGLTSADVSQLLYNAATRYLYAATGSGVFRSKDGAATWTSLNGDLPYLDVSRISISPDGLHLYAGTNAGIYELDVP